jgi:release factor glutamine methyltransferase
LVASSSKELMRRPSAEHMLAGVTHSTSTEIALDGRSIHEAVDVAATAFRATGCDAPAWEAEVIVAEALGISVADLHRNMAATLPPRTVGPAEAAIRRRLRREPVEYILGRSRFRGLELKVDQRVHIPRADRSGLLVEVALDLPDGSRVHEVGTGCGAVALAIKRERPDLEVTASDISPDAIAVARDNTIRFGLDIPLEVAGNLPPGSYDLVVANLPYSGEADLGDLPPETVDYQPTVAVLAGHDGLDLIRRLIEEMPPGTRLAAEHAPAQAVVLRDLLDEAITLRDVAGTQRVTSGIVR